MIPFITAGIIAAAAGVSTETIRRSIREGDLKAEHNGKGYMIPIEEAKQYLVQRGIHEKALENASDLWVGAKVERSGAVTSAVSKEAMAAAKEAVSRSFCAGGAVSGNAMEKPELPGKEVLTSVSSLGGIIGIAVGFAVAKVIQELFED